MLNVCVTNLGKYNEGDLIYEWLKLPCEQEDIDSVMKAIGINEEYEEYFLSDWESEYIFFDDMSEYSNLDTLNEKCRLLEENNNDLKLIESVVDVFGMSLEEAIENKDNFFYFYLDKDTLLSDELNLAYSYIEEFGFECALGDEMSKYFDFEKYGEDIRDGEIEYYEEEGNTKEVEYIESLSNYDLGYILIDEHYGGAEYLSKDMLERYFNYVAYGQYLNSVFSIYHEHMIAISS